MVWRYMDLMKFMNILQSGTLYFRRADKLGDPFEGSYSSPTLQELKTFLIDLHTDTEIFLHEFLKERADFAKKIRTCTAINCWHMNKAESIAMWQLYKADYGITIQSTFTRLKSSFHNTKEAIFIGKVTYIDYKRDVMTDDETLSPFLYKRKNYAHEREVRAVLLRPPVYGSKVVRSTIDHGVNVDVDLNMLIENVYVAPNTEEWAIKTVQSLVEHYGYKWKVMPSQIDMKPLW